MIKPNIKYFFIYCTYNLDVPLKILYPKRIQIIIYHYDI